MLISGSADDAYEGVVESIPVGGLFDFFICTFVDLLEFASGNESITRYEYHQDISFRYWSFILPENDTWSMVFVNREDSDLTIWFSAFLDDEPPVVTWNTGSIVYTSPVEIEIWVFDPGFNTFYFSVMLYDELIYENYSTTDIFGFTYSDTFTTSDLKGSSGRLNFSGYVNDTVGNGKHYGFTVRIVDPPPPTQTPTTSVTSDTTSTSTTTTDSEQPNIPLETGFVILLLSIIAVPFGFCFIFDRRKTPNVHTTGKKGTTHKDREDYVRK